MYEQSGLISQDLRNMEADSSFAHSSAEKLSNNPTATQMLSVSINTESEQSKKSLVTNGTKAKGKYVHIFRKDS